LSWFYAAIPVGSALGYGLGGLVGAHWGWRMAFFVVVPPGVLLGLMCLLMRDPQRGAAEEGGATAHTARWQDYLTLLRTPSYVYNTLGMTAMTFALGGVSFWMPDYIENYRDQKEIPVGVIFGGLTAIAGLIATPLGGLLGDRLTRRSPGAYFLVSAAGMLIGFPCFLLVLITPFPEAWGLIFVAEFCLFLNTGPTNTILANVAHPAIRASGYAMNILVIHLLGDVISPPLIGMITDLYGGNMNAGFVAVSLAILVSGVFWLLGAKHLARDTQLAPTRLNR
jgi:predicted MFS family arabinose efflux permease